jgi:hypothetical protein
MLQGKLIFAAVVVLAIAGAFVFGRTSGVNHERARSTLAVTDALIARERTYAREQAERLAQDQSDRDASRIAREALQRRIAELMSIPPTVLIKTKVVHDASGQECPAVPDGLSDQFWLRFFEAGDPAGPSPAAATSAVF